MSIYKILIRPVFFLINPESAHHLAFSLIKIAQTIPGVGLLTRKFFNKYNKPVKIFGLTFKNRVGLAAGLDKDAVLFNELGNYGFGFIEIGTLTPLPQPGNDKPRMFRLKSDEALINRMGFNNKGVNAAINKLKNNKGNVLVGGNIGKNKNTPNESAVSDYITCFNKLFNFVDYFVVNVSSPNTPGLRALQEKEPLLDILNAIQKENNSKEKPKPVLLKIAPDLTFEQLDDVVEIVFKSGINGIVATNTTISREGLKAQQEVITNIGNGGLSGRPLFKRSIEVVSYLYNKTNGAIPLIGVGGIHSADDAEKMIKAGASLVQLYTGFIYEGPSLVRKINKKLNHF